MRTKSLLLPVAILATFLVAAGPAHDQAGSSEAETVDDRSCSAEPDNRYDPPSGQEADECFDADGTFLPDEKYEATHWTNDVKCGTEDEAAPTHDATGVAVSADGAQEGTGGAGYLQVCNDGDLPIQGRITLEGSGGPDGIDGTATADGDRDNAPEQAQGWAQVDVGEPGVSCGKAYSEGGRADAHNQTEEGSGQEYCG